MHRSLLLARAGLLALGLAGLAALFGPSSGQEPKVKPFLDPERAFKIGDTDKDGKLSKDEFAKLLADPPDGIRNGGDTGPAVVPGDPAKSLLLKAIKQTGELKMPPKSKLSEEVVADFEKWIATGAADPREGKKAAAYKEIDIEKG